MVMNRVIPVAILLLSVAELILYGLADNSEGTNRTPQQTCIHVALKMFMLLICLLAGAQAVLLFVK